MIIHKTTHKILTCIILSWCALTASAQVSYTDKGQAVPPETVAMQASAFENHNNVEITWLTNAGFLINDHGNCILIDPMLQGYDLPLLRKAPIAPADIPALKGIMITHTDNDHMSLPTLKDLPHKDTEIYSTALVESALRAEGFHANARSNYQPFKVGNFEVQLVPAFHSYQYDYPGIGKPFGKDDCCGFLIKTSTGKVIWHMGDTRLLPDHMDLPWTPDVILMDLSDHYWHLGKQGARVISNHYKDALLFVCHWGTVDAPQADTFNGDPNELAEKINAPERIVVQAPGSPYILK